MSAHEDVGRVLVPDEIEAVVVGAGEAVDAPTNVLGSARERARAIVRRPEMRYPLRGVVVFMVVVFMVVVFMVVVLVVLVVFMVSSLGWYQEDG